MKQCTKCRELKPVDEFHFRKKRKIYESRCNKCRAEDNKRYPSYANRYSPSGLKYNLERQKEYIRRMEEKYGLGIRTIRNFGLNLALTVYDRCGRKCELCGEVNGLTIHHLDRNGRNNKEKGLPVNNDPSNLQVLCRRCHGSIHGKQSAEKRRNEKCV